MWGKILEINWKSRFGNQNVDSEALIEGTNGATVGSMTKVNAYLRKFLIIPEALVFGAAVLFILVLGEMNFFSGQVSWQTEPMSAIGKRSSSFILIRWLTVFVPFGRPMGTNRRCHTRYSRVAVLYPSRVAGFEGGNEPNCFQVPPQSSMHEGHRDKSSASSHYVATPGAIDERHSLSNGGGRTSTEPVITPLQRAVTPTGGKTPPECVPTMNPLQQAVTWRDGGRRRVARTLTTFSDRLVTATPNQFDDSAFRSGPAQNYPRIPAEELRNKRLNNIENRYEGNTTPRAQSPRRSHSGTFPAERSAGSIGDMPRRRPTLEVPPLDHLGRRRTLPASPITPDDSINQDPTSPTIVVSHDP